MKVKCPTCQKDVEWSASSTYRPFCSKRCQLIDLGEWAEEEHVISEPVIPGYNIDVDEYVIDDDNPLKH